MFLETDVTDEYKNEFKKLNITDLEDMLTVLNGLDKIAEIGYTVYNTITI